MIMPMTVMTVMTTWTRVFPLAAHSRSSTVSIKWRIAERLCRRRKNLPLLSDTLTFHIFTIVLLRGFFSTFLSLIHLWSRSRFSLISSESRKCQQSRKIVQWKPWKPNIDCWKRGYIAWFELTKMALWPYSQMHAFPKVDVFSKKSNLYLWHWVTRPKNFIETDTETFFRDQHFRDRDFFWDQIFLRPIPRLFFETKSFRDRYRDFFSRPNVFETDTETFFETKCFRDWYRYFF